MTQYNVTNYKSNTRSSLTINNKIRMNTLDDQLDKMVDDTADSFFNLLTHNTNNVTESTTKFFLDTNRTHTGLTIDGSGNITVNASGFDVALTTVVQSSSREIWSNIAAGDSIGGQWTLGFTLSGIDTNQNTQPTFYVIFNGQQVGLGTLTANNGQQTTMVTIPTTTALAGTTYQLDFIVEYNGSTRVSHAIAHTAGTAPTQRTNNAADLTTGLLDPARLAANPQANKIFKLTSSTAGAWVDDSGLLPLLDLPGSIGIGDDAEASWVNKRVVFGVVQSSSSIDLRSSTSRALGSQGDVIAFLNPTSIAITIDADDLDGTDTTFTIDTDDYMAFVKLGNDWKLFQHYDSSGGTVMSGYDDTAVRRLITTNTTNISNLQTLTTAYGVNLQNNANGILGNTNSINRLSNEFQIVKDHSDTMWGHIGNNLGNLDELAQDIIPQVGATTYTPHRHVHHVIDRLANNTTRYTSSGITTSNEANGQYTAVESPGNDFFFATMTGAVSSTREILLYVDSTNGDRWPTYSILNGIPYVNNGRPRIPANNPHSVQHVLRFGRATGETADSFNQNDTLQLRLLTPSGSALPTSGNVDLILDLHWNFDDNSGFNENEYTLDNVDVTTLFTGNNTKAWTDLPQYTYRNVTYQAQYRTYTHTGNERRLEFRMSPNSPNTLANDQYVRADHTGIRYTVVTGAEMPATTVWEPLTVVTGSPARELTGTSIGANAKIGFQAEKIVTTDQSSRFQIVPVAVLANGTVYQYNDFDPQWVHYDPSDIDLPQNKRSIFFTSTDIAGDLRHTDIVTLLRDHFDDVGGGYVDAVAGRTTLGVVPPTNFDGNVTIAGNLTVTGSTTTINSSAVALADHRIVLDRDATGTPAANNRPGIEIERGSAANVAIQWNENTDVWESTHDGTNYYTLLTTNSNINASRISGTIAQTRLGTTTADGRVLVASSGNTATWTATLSDSNIPSLAASKITSGSFNTARIPNLAASKITSGVFDRARLGNSSAAGVRVLTTNSSGTPTWVSSLAAAQIPSLNASKISAGNFHRAILGTASGSYRVLVTANSTTPQWVSNLPSRYLAGSASSGRILTTNGTNNSWTASLGTTQISNNAITSAKLATTVQSQLLPSYSTSNNDQVLGIVNGQRAWVAKATGGTTLPSFSAANNGDILSVASGALTWHTPGTQKIIEELFDEDFTLTNQNVSTGLGTNGTLDANSIGSDDILLFKHYTSSGIFTGAIPVKGEDFKSASGVAVGSIISGTGNNFSDSNNTFNDRIYLSRTTAGEIHIASSDQTNGSGRLVCFRIDDSISGIVGGGSSMSTTNAADLTSGFLSTDRLQDNSIEFAKIELPSGSAAGQAIVVNSSNDGFVLGTSNLPSDVLRRSGAELSGDDIVPTLDEMGIWDNGTPRITGVDQLNKVFGNTIRSEAFYNLTNTAQYSSYTDGGVHNIPNFFSVTNSQLNTLMSLAFAIQSGSGSTQWNRTSAEIRVPNSIGALGDRIVFYRREAANVSAVRETVPLRISWGQVSSTYTHTHELAAGETVTLECMKISGSTRFWARVSDNSLYHYNNPTLTTIADADFISFIDSSDTYTNRGGISTLRTVPRPKKITFANLKTAIGTTSYTLPTALSTLNTLAGTADEDQLVAFTGSGFKAIDAPSGGGGGGGSSAATIDIVQFGNPLTNTNGTWAATGIYLTDDGTGRANIAGTGVMHFAGSGLGTANTGDITGPDTSVSFAILRRELGELTGTRTANASSSGNDSTNTRSVFDYWNGGQVEGQLGLDTNNQILFFVAGGNPAVTPNEITIGQWVVTASGGGGLFSASDTEITENTNPLNATDMFHFRRSDTSYRIDWSRIVQDFVKTLADSSGHSDRVAAGILDADNHGTAVASSNIALSDRILLQDVSGTDNEDGHKPPYITTLSNMRSAMLTSGSISSSALASSSVTTTKIANNAVSDAKLADTTENKLNAPMILKVYRDVAGGTAVATPSATNYNLSSRGFTGLTNTWSDTAPTSLTTTNRDYYYSEVTIFKNIASNNLVSALTFSQPVKYHTTVAATALNIDNLTELTSPADQDFMVIEDATDNTNKKIGIARLKTVFATDISGKQNTIGARSLDPDRIAQDSATDGQVLTWDSTNNQWQPEDAASGGFTSTDALLNASSVNTSQDYFPVWNNAVANRMSIDQFIRNAQRPIAGTGATNYTGIWNYRAEATVNIPTSLPNNSVIGVNRRGSGTHTVNLPSTSTVGRGYVMTIVKLNGNGVNTTLVPALRSGSTNRQTIAGLGGSDGDDFTLKGQNSFITLMSDGTNDWILLDIQLNPREETVSLASNTNLTLDQCGAYLLMTPISTSVTFTLPDSIGLNNMPLWIYNASTINTLAVSGAVNVTIPTQTVQQFAKVGVAGSASGAGSWRPV